jgi:error-prone DNA polymerase
MAWRRGRGPVDDPPRPAVALRMGLSSVRGIGHEETARIEVARRVGGEFTGPEDLAHRTGLKVEALEALAASGAMESIGLGRREGLWAAGALAELGPDRLALAAGVAAPALPGLGDEEQARLERWATGVSLRHPVEFIRDRLTEIGCLTCMEALELKRHNKRIRVGGIVTHRQRPGTAAGIIFFNLEDETGLLNVVVFPDLWAQQRDVARKHPGLVIDGVLEYEDGVTNLVAKRFAPFPVEGVTSRNFR